MSYHLPREFDDLSYARRMKIAKEVDRQRNDAAGMCSVVCMKSLNHVYGLGLKTLAPLATKWGADIRAFYENGGIVHLDADRFYIPEVGVLLGDPLEQFEDLSERRKRQIASHLVSSRYEAAGNDMAIGVEIIHKQLGFGPARMERLMNQWKRDVIDFFTDRETIEPLLLEWLEDIGFIFEGGKLQVYKDADGKIVKKRTAEKWMEDD